MLCLPDAPAVLGYYTLSAGTIAPTDLDPDLARRLPRYDVLPVAHLGRLAIHQEHQRQGFGTMLLIDALRRSLVLQSQLGAMAVTVQAKDAAARAFYEHYGFVRFAHHEFQLYRPMRTIAQLNPGSERLANRAADPSAP